MNTFLDDFDWWTGVLVYMAYKLIRLVERTFCFTEIVCSCFECLLFGGVGERTVNMPVPTDGSRDPPLDQWPTVQVRSECLTCTFRASCGSARLSRAKVSDFISTYVYHIYNTILNYSVENIGSEMNLIHVFKPCVLALVINYNDTQ